MRISDWSSDVCSSDLLAASFAAVLALMIGMQLWNEPAPTPVAPATVVADTGTDADIDAVLDENPDLYLWLASNDAYALAIDRKSVVEGKRLSVRVDLGGRRIIKKKNKKKNRRK